MIIRTRSFHAIFTYLTVCVLSGFVSVSASIVASTLDHIRDAQPLGVRGITALQGEIFLLKSGDKSPHSKELSCSPSDQKKASAVSSPIQLLTRRSTRQETIRFGYGGTVSLVGAPEGAITIEGWSRTEVEVTGEIELRAETEEDLARLATVNGFLVDSDGNHLHILSTGTHDRTYMRRVAKDFPKKLLGLPWAINYRIRVPIYTDLEVDAGRGQIALSGVEGGVRLTATESETQLTLTGGTVFATIASGKVRLNIPARSWRGSGADIRLANGELTIELPVGFNGEIDASILRSGAIQQEYPGLEARERQGFTAKEVKARAGAGGPSFQFIVGDGTIYIRKASGP